MCVAGLRDIYECSSKLCLVSGGYSSDLPVGATVKLRGWGGAGGAEDVSGSAGGRGDGLCSVAALGGGELARWWERLAGDELPATGHC